MTRLAALVLAALLVAAPLASAELRYNTVVRIASGGESLDFARYEHVRPILQITHRGSRTLPADSKVVIEAAAGPIVLRPDPLGSIEWPLSRELATANPKVTSIPHDLAAVGLIRVATRPSTAVTPVTVGAMVAEYERFIRELPFLKRIVAPRPRSLLIVATGPMMASSMAGNWQSPGGPLRIPLDLASAAPLTLSTMPTLVLLDLGLE